MQKTNKALERLRAKPKELAWRELQAALTSLGFSEHQRSGSRVCFVHTETNQKIQLHKRHPNSTLLPYQIKSVLEMLIEFGHL